MRPLIKLIKRGILGGDGGFLPTKRMKGETALKMMARTRICRWRSVVVLYLARKLHTDLRTSLTAGEMSWPIALPTGNATMNIISTIGSVNRTTFNLPIESTIVAVVLLFSSNHISENLGARTWNVTWGMPLKACQEKSSMSMSLYSVPPSSNLLVPPWAKHKRSLNQGLDSFQLDDPNQKVLGKVLQ